MKILIATGLYYPDIGGPATYVKMLEQHLPSKDVELTVVPYSLVNTFPKIVKHFRYAQLLWRASKDADIVFALDPVSVGLPAMIVAKLRQKKFVLRVPGDYAWEQGQLRYGVTDTFHTFIEKRYSYGWKVSLLNRIESMVARSAQLIIVPSDYMKNAVPKWGVPKEKVQRIYSALETIEPSNELLPDALLQHRPLIVSSGRLVPNKGFLELIQAFATFKEKHSSAGLVIIGDGPQEAELRAFAEQCNLRDSVILTGKLRREKLATYIRAADMYVLNTAHEGLSHQLLEVMHLKTPIVTTPVGGNTELIVDGKTGLLFTYDDKDRMVSAMEKILTDTKLVDTMVENAYQKTKEFTAVASVNQTLMALERVAQK